MTAQTSEVPGETENQQTDNIARLSSVPPSTPTPKGVDNLSKDVEDSQEREGGVGEEDSQSLLMEVVSQIAAEPGADYMQDIWQLQLRDLRKACLECIPWPQPKQAPFVRSKSFNETL